MALFAGTLATIFASLVCMGIALISGWHVGYFALGVGILVGLVIRGTGRGSHVIFGALGVFFTLLTCLLGEMGADIQAATTPRLDFYGVLSSMNLVTLADNIISHTDVMIAVSYAVGAFVAFQLSRR